MKKTLFIGLILYIQFVFPQYVPTREEEAFLDTLQYRSFLYFMDEINPDNGLVKDRTADWSAASIAAVGWGVVAWAIGAEHNWITREKATRLTLNLVRFLFNSEQSAEPDATGYNGFYYHFLDIIYLAWGVSSGSL